MPTKLEVLLLFCFLTVLLVLPAAAQQRATLTGTVTDAFDGEPLIGANVILVGTPYGTATGADGQYTLSGLEPGSYTVAVRYIGYQELTEAVTLDAGETHRFDAALSQQGLDLNTVVVTASRQEEKALDAPASISVLDAQEITRTVATSAVEALRNTPGVDMSQTGVDRREVVLRGFNNAFSGATYALVDYRQAAAPALAVNLWSIMPNTPIDVERVEVVRGPGSALYGAGVDAGVVHFITKDPFQNPGTTVALMGGERGALGGQLRHAGTVGEQFGYKIVGEYLQANEWELDPGDPLDAEFLDDEVVPRNYDYQKYRVNGELHYRLNTQTSLIANVGTSSLTTPTLSGIGSLQADGYGYTYAQLRFQSGGFFAQAYGNFNDAGDSFVYGRDIDNNNEPDPVVDKGQLYNAQAQYEFDLLGGRQQFIAGADFESITPRTEGTINGRNEDDDTITETGAYLQSTTNVTAQFDLTLALRGDYNNIVDDFQLSPRAALVFKPALNHTLRATYNRAFSSPSSNSNFLDIVAQTPRVGSPFVVRARGAADGFTFPRNPQWEAVFGSDLVASSLIGCVGENGLPLANPASTCGADAPVGLATGDIYASIHASLDGTPTPAVTQGLINAGLLPDPGDNAEARAQLEAQVDGIIALLDPSVTNVEGVTQGSLGLLNLTTGEFEGVPDAVDVEPLKQTTSSTIELGYKGILTNRVLIAIDGYYTRKENFIGPLLIETPMVFVRDLAEDLQADLAAGISGNATLAAALGQFGLTPEQVAAAIVTLAGGSLPGENTPVAIVQPNENDAGAGTVPEMMLTYRNFGQVDYYGVDASVQVLVNDALNVFGNVSWVSDDFFDADEVDEENEQLSIALNAPSFKGKLGFDYALASGFSFNASGRYTEGFPVRSGPYTGEVDDYFILDLGLGYDFQTYVPGLRLDVTVLNVLDNMHREFVGAPEIGRMGLARLTYSFE